MPPTDPTPPRLIKVVILMASLVFLLYANTLKHPFQFDDVDSALRDPGDTAKFLQWQHPQYRHLTYLSFSLNLIHGGNNPLGFRAVNIILHFGTAAFFFVIARTVFHLGAGWRRETASRAALAAALLFVIHPAQTETVTYISGRSGGLAAFFFCLAFWMFLLAGQRNVRAGARVLYFAVSLIAYGAAVLGKETAAVFPLLALLFDFMVMRRSENWAPFKTRLPAFYIPVAAAAVLLLLSAKTLILILRLWLEKLSFVYLLRQAEVLLHPLRIFFLPINLNMDYDFSPDLVLLSPSFLAAAGAHLFLAWLLIRKIYPASPVLAFSLTWFYLTIAPTNSLLPRADLFSERNLYLPSMGLSLGLSLAAGPWLGKMPRAVFACFCIIPLCLGALTVKRNAVFHSEVSLWEDTFRKSPEKLRVMQNLVRSYMQTNDYQKAFVVLKKMRDLNPRYYFTRVNLGKIYAHFGDTAQALRELNEAIAIDPEQPEAHINFGSHLAAGGNLVEATAEYERAFSWYVQHQLSPPPELILNRAWLFLTMKRYAESKTAAQAYLQARGETPEGHLLLAQIHREEGNNTAARTELMIVKGHPELEAKAANLLAMIYIEEGNFPKAVEALENAVRLAPNMMEPRYNLGKALIESGADPARARRHLEQALTLTEDPEKRAAILLLLGR